MTAARIGRGSGVVYPGRGGERVSPSGGRGGRSSGMALGRRQLLLNYFRVSIDFLDCTVGVEPAYQGVPAGRAGSRSKSRASSPRARTSSFSFP